MCDAKNSDIIFLIIVTAKATTLDFNPLRYYDNEVFPNTAAQKKFEKSLFTKTHKVTTILSLGSLALTSRPMLRSSCWTD